MEQHKFNRLYMVQFDYPRVIQPFVSFTFEEFPFPILCHGFFLPSSLPVIKKW